MSDFEKVTLWYIFLFIIHNSHNAQSGLDLTRRTQIYLQHVDQKFVTLCHQAKINSEKSYQVFFSVEKDFLNLFCRNDRV